MLTLATLLMGIVPMQVGAQSRNRASRVRKAATPTHVSTKVQWTITPKTAQVTIDGNSTHNVTNGNLEVTLAEGEHTYKVTADGYRTHEGTLRTARKDAISLSVNLRSKNIGGIDIAAFPDDVSINFNGQTYQTSVSIDTLASGNYRTSFSKEGYTPLDTTLIVKDGLTSYYNIFLQRGNYAVAHKADKSKNTTLAKAEKPSKTTTKPTKHSAKSTNKHSTDYLIMAQGGYDFNGDPSFGLMLGMVKQNGFYLKGMSSFNMQFVNYECPESGEVFIPNSGLKKVFYKEGFKYKTLYGSAGYLRKLCKPLIAYVGAGYGKHEVIWTTIDDKNVVNRGLSTQGVIAEGGLILKVGKFALSCGAQTVRFRSCELQVGIGVAL